MSKSNSYLVHRKNGSSYFFRSIIPKDLQSKLGKREFQLSLRCGILKQAKSLSFQLFNKTQLIYASIRDESMSKHISTQQIKELLKQELDQNNSQQSQSSKQEENNLANNQSKQKIRHKSSDCVSLAELCKKFTEPRLDRGFNEKTINDYQDSNNLLLEFFGNVPIDTLTHQNGRDYIQLLKHLPTNRKKKYPNKTIKQLVELKDVQLMSPRTISKQVNTPKEYRLYSTGQLIKVTLIKMYSEANWNQFEQLKKLRSTLLIRN